ncbi:hypothetical protein FQB35_11685 [Crassaminicella thermophila]|uniref:Uncharacterized protein n=1 Tax=Crassaminicella thermophila TaxID=2599308 RepID=A0A5C0SG73_CRATE|nr:hypothetical protein [Crassaminicella thermophila]QEK12932.1 hypothetical protein FQB35_11685 [Crassaminicella thermophila]
MKIISLKNEISSDTAISILKQKDSTVNVNLIEPIYYPYYRLIASVKTKIFARSFDGTLSCLIDLVNGVEAITGEECQTEQIFVDGSSILPISIENEKARKKALGCIRHTIIQKMKVLSIPKIIPVDEDFFYRPFWIIHCLSNKDNHFYVMMDGISGQYQLLDL